jgi:hypothetical protein
MKLKKLTVYLITLLLVLPAVAEEDNEETSELSNTYNASCILKITANPEILPMNSQIMYYLLTSSAVAGKASRQVLDVSFDQISDSISIEMLPSDQDNIPGIRGGMMRGMGGGMGGGGMGGGPGAGMGGGMMGGMGGGMGGMGGGMGGMGGGMMGGVSETVPMDTSESRPPRPAARRSAGSSRGSSTARPITAERTAIFHLQINLNQDLKPAALEFRNSIIENLRESLTSSYQVQKKQLEDERDIANQQLLNAEQNLQSVMGVDEVANAETQRLLDEKVDLSMLTPDTTFAEALDILKHSVEPPLQINVYWTNLNESAAIGQTDPINMDGLRNVRLANALQALLDNVSGEYADLGYKVDDGIIKIATKEKLLKSHPELTQMFPQDIALDSLLERKQSLLENKQHLELLLATYQARQQAIQEQIQRIQEQIDFKLQSNPIIRELQTLLEIQSKNVRDTQAQIEAGKAKQSDLAEVQRNLSRAKIDLAQQRQQLSKSEGGEQLSSLNSDLSKIAIDVAERTAELGIITKQLEQINQQIAAASTYESPKPHIQIASHQLQLAKDRLMQIETKLANLHPPTVTVLGAD